MSIVPFENNYVSIALPAISKGVNGQVLSRILIKVRTLKKSNYQK
jgi:hypothetical protein